MRDKLIEVLELGDIHGEPYSVIADKIIAWHLPLGDKAYTMGMEDASVGYIKASDANLKIAKEYNEGYEDGKRFMEDNFAKEVEARLIAADVVRRDSIEICPECKGSKKLYYSDDQYVDCKCGKGWVSE